MNVIAFIFALALSGTEDRCQEAQPAMPITSPRTPKASRRSATPPTGVRRGLTTAEMDPNFRSALLQLQASLPLITAELEEHTLGEALDRYVDEHLYVDGLKPSTIEWRERTIAVLRRWEHRPAAGRFRDVAAQLYREARETGLKEATPSMQVNTLSRVLNLAKTWGWRHDDHDLKGLCRVRSGRRTGVVLPEHLAAIGRGLDELDERPRIHVACECVRFVLLTGWRVSEAASIEWALADAKRSTIHLPDTKTGAQTRVVASLAWAVVRRQPKTSRWVFPRRRGDGPIHRRQVLEALQRACKLGGVPRYVVHLLRHTFASTGSQLDLPSVNLSPALGHTVEWQTTQYQHARTKDVKRAVNKVSREIKKAVG